MKAEIEARIAELTQQRDALQADLDAEVAKMNKLMSDVPSEFHTMTREVFDKIKEFFA